MSKTFVILRGLPGSGKSTFIRNHVGGILTIISADNYFIGPDWVYRFDPTQIGRAHAECMVSAIRAVHVNTKKIVLDNTNSQTWEYMAYIALAKTHGYEVKVYDLYDGGGKTDQELADRNQHGVPVDSITAMRARWEHIEADRSEKTYRYTLKSLILQDIAKEKGVDIVVLRMKEEW